MKYTSQSILDAALRQSAVDAGCEKEDFLRSTPVVVDSQTNPGPGGIWSYPSTAT